MLAAPRKCPGVGDPFGGRVATRGGRNRVAAFLANTVAPKCNGLNHCPWARTFYGALAGPIVIWADSFC